jgi:ribosomal subunit interface protein
MQVPLQITFRHMEPSNAVEARIRERCHKLEQFAEHVTSCRVTIEAPHKHHHKGSLYQVTIDITLPGEELVASRHSDILHAHEDVYVAIRDAFDAARRQLEDYVRRQRADIKLHTPLSPRPNRGALSTR